MPRLILLLAIGLIGWIVYQRLKGIPPQQRKARQTRFETPRHTSHRKPPALPDRECSPDVHRARYHCSSRTDGKDPSRTSTSC